MNDDLAARPIDVVDACRLAMVAGANEHAKLAVVEALLAKAPDPVNGPDSVRLLVDTLKEIGGKFEVTSVTAEHRSPAIEDPGTEGTK